MTSASAPIPATGVLLAAGWGRRAGGPKALIELDGRRLWQVRRDALLDAGLARVVAVVHPWARTDVDADPDTLIGDPDATPLHSLLVALAHVETGPVVVQHVDGGGPSPETLGRLYAQSLAVPTALALRPVVVVDGVVRGGHPVWLSAAACTLLRGLDPAHHRLDVVLRGWGQAYLDVPVEDLNVLANFNRDGVAS